jgi:hypothetical protein
MKVWITKYALTKGIFSIDAEVGDGMARNTANSYWEIYHGLGRDWHHEFPDAVQRARKMRDEKIISLNKQIARLKTLKFEAPQ